jgi:hypothetical protein
MAKWMILTGAATVALVAFVWLALAMQEHWQQVHGGAEPSSGTQTMLRVLGIFGIIASGVLCFVADRPSMAALNWVMLMTLSAVSVALTLAWKPGLLRLVWPGRRSSAADR